MQEYTLAQNRWYGDEPTTISLPDDWDVQFLSSRGDERSALSAEQIRERFRHPVGSRTIRELAENAEQVVIVFDDLTRGTPVQTNRRSGSGGAARRGYSEKPHPVYLRHGSARGALPQRLCPKVGRADHPGIRGF